MKLTAVLVLAAVAVAGASAESSNMVTFDPNTFTRVDPATIADRRPHIPVGSNDKFTWEVSGPHKDSGSGSNYHTIDPRTLPTQNPAYLQGLGPQVPIKDHRQLESTNTLTVNPNTLPTMDPKYLEGLGPQTPAGDNPKLKKAMEELASKDGSGNSNYYTIDPKSLPTMDPKYLEGLGPQTPLSSTLNCDYVCPDVYDPVCGSDGVTYSNSCKLGIARCKNPMKKIAQKSEGRC
ncbi:protease inhibitor Epi7 [Phytophthora palmivora]|uniref:Protease inhibitor Epi7 n=1 Tax=Phytophthora palmivora TaxID=4796 RepID=A0A2P4Y886_9STRA|nr:protease inhibitor Epi7 [Phytophthora palmivora]